MQIIYDVTKREKDIMNILWETDTPLIASQISQYNKVISISTVQTVLKSLMKKGLVEVAEIVHSGTVLTRSYRTVMSSEQYELQKVAHSFKELVSKDISTSCFVATLLEQEKDNSIAIQELEDLEKMLKEKKKQLLTEMRQTDSLDK